MADRPSTASTLWAEWRRGLKDLQNAVLNPWNGFAATHEEPGTIANPTQQQVTMSQGDRVENIFEERKAQREADWLEAKDRERSGPEVRVQEPQIRANSVTGQPEKVVPLRDELQAGFGKVMPSDERSEAGASQAATREADGWDAMRGSYAPQKPPDVQAPELGMEPQNRETERGMEIE